MDFGTFSERVMDFSEGEIGNFGGFMFILFRASDGNRRLCAVRRNFRKTKNSALILEKVLNAVLKRPRQF